MVLYSIIYSEDYMTQFLDNLLVCLYKVVLDKSNKLIKRNIELSIRMIGRYCSPKSYQTLIMSAIKNELASFYSYRQAGAVRTFGILFEGATELINKTEQMSKVEEILNEFIHYGKTELVDQLDLELSELTVETLQRVL